VLGLQQVPAKNEASIQELETLEEKLEEDRQTAEQKHAEVLASLQTDTIKLQVCLASNGIFHWYELFT